IYIGGGQGERNGKATFAALAKPLGIVTEDKLIKTLDAIVKVHEEWGDRQNRHWARMKYVVHMKGVNWFREQLKTKGVELEPPDEQLDIGDRHLHHGWMPQENNGLWSFGAFIENGRVIDSEQVQLKSMVKHLMDAYETQLLITPNQDLIFTDIAEGKKGDFEQAMQRFGYGKRKGKPYSALRLKSGSCVALPTCRLAYTDSERFLPELIDELEERGYGEMTESIGITGCERQCFRPATKTIGWIGTGKNRYQLKLLGSENARHQGKPLIGKDQLMVLRMVPRDKIAAVTAALFDYYKTNRNNANEGMGEFHNRIGLEAIIDHLKTNEVTSELMKKTFKPIYIEQD
ncbi:MAG: nitrite/sulfite reductase, partial [Planctomycetes bacterium]|nr:nitrite/sulfite reductase [Planctomycetota bacterium]